MPSYVVTGASRGLGYEFIKHLARSSTNTVVGLVRNKSSTLARLSKDSITNVHIIEADITSLSAQLAAAAEVAKVTGGSLDYLINNAAWVSDYSQYTTMADFEKSGFEALEKDLMHSLEINVLGVAKTITAFLPLLKKSSIKKVATISTGMADIDLIKRFNISIAPSYAVSKAAINALVAKYAAAYGPSEGILFISISPGLVDTAERTEPPAKEELAGMEAMINQFKEYAPGFKGPITPAESVEKVLGVVERKSVENGDGGAFVSHLGNQQWL